ncbi:MAG: hypothetical protein ACOYD0_07715 [Candidatus Nanopelagicales bacterium]
MSERSTSAAPLIAVLAEPIPRSAVLAAWWNGWSRGLVPPDDLLDAMATFGTHRVRTPQGESIPLLAGLADCVAPGADARVRVALPRAGDLAGLPGPELFNRQALAAGQAVVSMTGVCALVPVGHEKLTTWSAMRVESDRTSVVPLGPEEASTAVRKALQVATAELVGMDLSGSRDAVSDALDSLDDSLRRIQFPSCLPGPAIHTAHTAARVLVTVAIAQADTGHPTSALVAQRRGVVLADLARTARYCLAAACSAR